MTKAPARPKYTAEWARKLHARRITELQAQIMIANAALETRLRRVWEWERHTKTRPAPHNWFDRAEDMMIDRYLGLKLKEIGKKHGITGNRVRDLSEKAVRYLPRKVRQERGIKLHIDWWEKQP